MNSLKRKLKSESGASIMLALLFFLICALAASVLLMAAVSNAGKIKSSRELHREYLAVSSAMELVCEDLLSAEYCGQYTYRQETVIKEEPNPDWNPLLPWSEEKIKVEYRENYYNQTKGTYQCGLSDLLAGELDGIFAQQMKTDIEGFPDRPKESTFVTTLGYGGGSNVTHTLTVTPEIEEGELSGADLSDLAVEVTVTLDKASYTIDLSARLIGDPDSYPIEAELTPSANFPRPVKQSQDGTYLTDPMTWKLGWITKASEGAI